MEVNKIIHGNCIEVMKTFPDNSIDSIVCDPPYALTTTKRWKDSIEFAQNQSDVGKRFSKGFMGKEWDGKLPDIDTWIECLRVAKPGAHMLAFGGTRTHHRLMVAIEDAGWEIRDTLMWVYGSGYPKSLNVSKAIDKELGAERTVVGRDMNAYRPNAVQAHKNGQVAALGLKPDGSGLITIPSTEEAKEWDGWGTALKPSWEPIILVRKPIEGTVAQNTLKWGVGGINIDGCRVEGIVNSNPLVRNARGYSSNGLIQGKTGKGVVSEGRFPANFIHDGSQTVLDLFPITKSGDNCTRTKTGSFLEHGGLGKAGDIQVTYGDSGSAARFFYCAKVGQREREAGLYGIKFDCLEIIISSVGDNKIIWTGKLTTSGGMLAKQWVDMDASLKKAIGEYGIQPKNDLDSNMLSFGKIILEKYLMDTTYTTKMGINLTTPPQILNWLQTYTIKESIRDAFLKMMDGGNLVVIVENSNTLTIIINEKAGLVHGASNVVLKMQLLIKEKEITNTHPTLKPISLMRYLCRLVTPKNALVLDPFTGSGSTCIAAVLEGFNYVGIELETEYVEIANKRINYWKANPPTKL